MTNKIIQGDCLVKLKGLPENSIDSIVTDPPYELGFMGKSWDNTGIANNPEMWKECLRVLKPGGHLLAFSGTRTYHRMACAIEDAGFEVRDMIEWVTGSGFPKSLNIGKAVDKLQGNEREVVGDNPNDRSSHGKNAISMCNSVDGKITKGTSEWEGWGTALKPSHEPICMARKPLAEKTVAENCLKWGTGGINIDESRVKHNEPEWHTTRNPRKDDTTFSNKTCGFNSENTTLASANPQGRFPANIIHDGSEEVRECFPENIKGEIGRAGRKSGGNYEASSYKVGVVTETGFKDNGNASRFFKNIEQVVDLNDFSMYNRSIIINIKKLCGQHLTKKKTGIILDGVIQEVEKFIQDAELLISGNSTMEKFLTDIAFTIKTLIAQMTELKTLNVLPNWLITKFTENYEQTIKLLKELNTEDVRSAKSIFLLQTFINEVLESIRDIAENVVKKDSNNGEKVSDSFFKSILYYPKASKSERNAGLDVIEDKNKRPQGEAFGDGSAITEHSERKGNFHPTVKPIALMEYLIKMVTPSGGIVLDPFAGSGSTLIAAKQNGYQYIGIEMTPEYIPIIEARLNYEK